MGHSGFGAPGVQKWEKELSVISSIHFFSSNESVVPLLWAFYFLGILIFTIYNWPRASSQPDKIFFASILIYSSSPYSDISFLSPLYPTLSRPLFLLPLLHSLVKWDCYKMITDFLKQINTLLNSLGGCSIRRWVKRESGYAFVEFLRQYWDCPNAGASNNKKM